MHIPPDLCRQGRDLCQGFSLHTLGGHGVRTRAWGQDSLPLLHRSWHSQAATSPTSDKGFQLPEPHYSHIYTHPQTTPTVATTLSRNTSSPDMAPCAANLLSASADSLGLMGSPLSATNCSAESLMNSHITLPLEQRFNHLSLTSGTKDLILQHLPQTTCSDSGERCFGSSWAPGRNKISSVSKYLLNTLIFSWRIQPVFSVLAGSICTRNLLQDVDKMEAPSLTCRCRYHKGDAGVYHNHCPKSCTNLFCTYRVNQVSDSQNQKGLNHSRSRQGHSKCQQWAGRMEWCMLCAVPLQRSPPLS